MCGKTKKNRWTLLPGEFQRGIVMRSQSSSGKLGMVSMFAVKFERDVDVSVAVVCGSTLLSILTMPPIVALAMAVL